MNTKYKIAYILTKHTNLLQWFYENIKEPKLGGAEHQAWERMRERYAKPQDVRLVLLLRYDEDGELHCRIRCPINPLPVKGEFVAPSLRCIVDFLCKNDWEIKEKISASMFN